MSMYIYIYMFTYIYRYICVYIYIYTYIYPRSNKSSQGRWYVGLKYPRKQDSPPPQDAECPAKRPRSDSEGPEPDAGAARSPRTLGFCLYCCEEVAADSAHSLDGDQPYHLACKPAVPISKPAQVKGVCQKCGLKVYDNCVRGTTPQGTYMHVHCTSAVPKRKVTTCGCGLCAGK